MAVDGFNVCASSFPPQIRRERQNCQSESQDIEIFVPQFPKPLPFPWLSLNLLSPQNSESRNIAGSRVTADDTMAHCPPGAIMD